MRKVVLMSAVILAFILYKNIETNNKEMTIRPIAYPDENGTKKYPLYRDIYEIDNFKDGKKSIKKLFDYLDEEIRMRLPFWDEKEYYSMHIYFDEDDINTFDFRSHWTDEGSESIVVIFYYKNYEYFEGLIFPQVLNKLNHVLQGDKVIIDYENFNANSLQNFINIAEEIHKETKQKSFLMVQKNSNKLEAKIDYIGRDNAFSFEIVE